MINRSFTARCGLDFSLKEQMRRTEVVVGAGRFGPIVERKGRSRRMTPQGTQAAAKPKTADMHPGPGFRVRSDIDRPKKQTITGLGRFETPSISDQLNRLYTMMPEI